MSKEQTPITAEEFLNEISILCDGYTYYETKKDILKVMEQYAQAKVLEALEREEEFFCENSKINAFRETISNAEWRRLIKIHFRRSKKQK